MLVVRRGLLNFSFLGVAASEQVPPQAQGLQTSRLVINHYACSAMFSRYLKRVLHKQSVVIHFCNQQKIAKI